MGAGADDDWVNAAMEDDTLAVEMLMRLHNAPPASSSSSRKRPTALPLEWTVRQRRSRSQTIFAKRKKESQRASPTTPLTWSGATSLSGGSDESSRLLPAKLSLAAARSKVNERETANSKRLRRKKTLPELKEEESSLLKEQRVLKKEIAKLRMHLEKQRETNQKLKKIKIESKPLVYQDSSSPKDRSVSYNDDNAQHAPPSRNAFSEFMLPDLNVPFEEAPLPEVIFGVSSSSHIGNNDYHHCDCFRELKCNCKIDPQAKCSNTAKSLPCCSI